MMFSRDSLEAAKAHAIAAYPHESCGLIVKDRYIPCTNVAADKEKTFQISDAEIVKLLGEGRAYDAVIHSHPNGPAYPSKDDMEQQIASGVPWGIVVTNGEDALDPIFWGDTLPIAPLIGREFRHGVADCYSLVRDAFRLGKEKMAEQDMPEWPFDPIVMPEVARDDEWWKGEDDLYTAYFEKEGWVPIQREEVRPGDGFLMKVRSDKLNHAGLYVGNNLILHHLPTRLSRREPAGIWARSADLWLRFVGKSA